MVKDNAVFLYTPHPVLTVFMSYVNMVRWSNWHIDIDILLLTKFQKLVRFHQFPTIILFLFQDLMEPTILHLVISSFLFWSVAVSWSFLSFYDFDGLEE